MFDFLLKNKTIIFNEVVPRVFFSNYLTILNAFDYLLSRNITPENRIFISDQMFFLYGDPRHWFVGDRIVPNLKGRQLTQ